jgi:ferritin-like metal-binding protein YciE
MADGAPLHELFVDEPIDLDNGENQLIKALPPMARAAATPELRRAFEDHLGETRRQAQRLEQTGLSPEVTIAAAKHHMHA